MKQTLSKRIRFFATFGLLCQTVGALFMPLTAHAEIIHPQTVSIEYANSELHLMSGTFKDGRSYVKKDAPLYAVFNGQRQEVFCLEPEVTIPDEVSPGYEKNPLPKISKKAKLVSVLWKRAGTDIETNLAAQTMIWEEVNGLHIQQMTRPDGSIVSNLDLIRTKIDQIVSDYQKQPSFNKQTAKVALGKSLTLTDTNAADLSDFDQVVENSANVDYFVNGKQLTITPNENSKTTGTLKLAKSSDVGTPIVYKKAGLQTVMAGAINEPNVYTVNIQIEKNGSLKIVKRDKQSGELVPNTIFHLDFGGVLPEREVKTGADGSATLTDIPHGTKVTITEKEVPTPYTIDPTLLEAVIKAGETIEVTSKNYREKGQIVLEKTGLETGRNLWNAHYSLAGNTFEVRKDAPSGNIVQRITTDETGHAETTKDAESALELGTYFVTESKASAGFINSFQPVKVDLSYADQTVPLVVKNIKGTNQEVTGQTTLTKIDKDTNDKTQGAATFKGAEYSLYYGEDSGTHKIGDPVKWTDNFKPERLKGKHAKNLAAKDTVTLVIDENRQVGVKHLAVGKYFWRESKAPIGYTLDETKYEFTIDKKDDAKINAVITQNVTAKEQVIRFGFDYFKFANSAAGSASAGFNDLKFKLTPLEATKPITGAKDTAITSYDVGSGFDGYGKFEHLPYGSYRLEEVAAPKGFQKIKPLVIRSNFEENEDNYADSQYVFTITEEGQKDPIKTVKVPYKQLTDKAFLISLNRLLLYDLPEAENSLTSLATWKNGEKELSDQKNARLLDRVSYQLDQTKKDWFVVSKVVDVAATKAALKKDKNADSVVVSEIASTQANSERKGVWEIKQELPLEKIQNKTLVLFNYVYQNEKAYRDGEKPIAVDDQLENPAQTVTVKLKKFVGIKTKAHLKDGSDKYTRGDIVDMYDDVTLTHDVLDGSQEAFETILYAIHPEGKTEEIWKSGLIEYMVSDKEFTKTVVAEKIDTSKYPKGTVFTFKEINYDKDGKENARHNDDLKEKSQTIYPKETPEVPDKPIEPETPKPSHKTYPQTGEMEGNQILLFIGFALIFVVTTWYFWKHHGGDL